MRKYTKEEKEELKRISVEEGKTLKKRPMYVAGQVILFLWLYYCLFRLVGIESLSGLTKKQIIVIAVDVLLGFTASLLFKMAVKVSLGQAITFGALMTFIGVKSTLVGPTSLSNWNWTYLIYIVIVFACIIMYGNSIEKHFCERIYMMRKEAEEEK